MLNVTLTSATGKKYLLSGTDTQSPVLAPMGALVELIGQASRTDQVVPARAGALAGRTRWGVLEKDVELYLHAETGEELDALDAELRSGLHVWAPDRVVPQKPATLEIETNNPPGAVFPRCVAIASAAGTGSGFAHPDIHDDYGSAFQPAWAFPHCTA